MQSGTFDLKTAGNYTETLTIDANSAAAKQLQQPLATPAPSTATAIRTNYTAVTSSRLTSASCLKGATTANCASAPHMLPEHAGRAVTFAADVVDVVSHEHVRRPGKLMCFRQTGAHQLLPMSKMHSSTNLRAMPHQPPILTCNSSHPQCVVPMLYRFSRSTQQFNNTDNRRSYWMSIHLQHIQQINHLR